MSSLETNSSDSEHQDRTFVIEDSDDSKSSTDHDDMGPQLTKINTLTQKSESKHRKTPQKRKAEPVSLKSEPKQKKKKLKSEEGPPKRKHSGKREESEDIKKPTTKRGQVFGTNEITFMLFCLYQGLDNKACAEAYLKHFKGTSRTKLTLQNKFGSLRAEAVSKMTSQIINTDRQHAYDALRPVLVEKDSTWYLCTRKQISKTSKLPLLKEG
jgi:hypothetical protein